MAQQHPRKHWCSQWDSTGMAQPHLRGAGGTGKKPQPNPHGLGVCVILVSTACSHLPLPHPLWSRADQMPDSSFWLQTHPSQRAQRCPLPSRCSCTRSSGLQTCDHCTTVLRAGAFTPPTPCLKAASTACSRLGTHHHHSFPPPAPALKTNRRRENTASRKMCEQGNEKAQRPQCSGVQLGAHRAAARHKQQSVRAWVCCPAARLRAVQDEVLSGMVPVVFSTQDPFYTLGRSSHRHEGTGPDGPGSLRTALPPNGPGVLPTHTHTHRQPIPTPISNAYLYLRPSHTHTYTKYIPIPQCNSCTDPHP